MAAASSNEDISISMSISNLPRTSADMSSNQPPNSIMNQLSDVLAGTTLEQPPASVMNHLSDVLAGTTLDEPQVPSKLLSRKERKKQRKNPRLQDAASAERLSAKRAKRNPKGQAWKVARKLKKQRRRERKLMNGLPSSTCKGPRKRAVPEKSHNFTSLSRSSLLPEMIRDHETTQGQEDKEQKDGRLQRLLTKIELAKQALQEREAIHTHRKARRTPASERRSQEYSPGGDVDGLTDTVME